MGKMGKKLFNLAAIITSLYRVITVMTLRHRYVIMSHIQRVSYYVTFLSKVPFSKKSVDFRGNVIFEKKMLRNEMT
jgi:hypothetical protein